MASSKYRPQKLDPTSGAVSFPVSEGDDFDVKRVCLVFATQPAAIENVQVFVRSALGSAFDCLIRTEDPNGCNSVTFEDIDGISNGDHIEVVYLNSGGVEVRGTATVKL
ncbi:hypothetical protein KAR91_53345 [Candidatus Pacearchaeota archaeon]|nr:hypothetical protein [Candidatus Pacearchaeota archaeon]